MSHVFLCHARKKNRALLPGLGPNHLNSDANSDALERPCYFAAALSAAISASLRNVIAPIWLSR